MIWLIRTLLERLGLISSQRSFYLDADTLHSIERLAVLEERPREEVVEELIELGLSHRWAVDERWQLWNRLTEREREVLALACLGYTNKEIGRRLGIKSATVKSHLYKIYKASELITRKSDLRVVFADWDFEGWDQP